MKNNILLLLMAFGLQALPVGAVDLSTAPMLITTAVKPNIIMVYDDSGSMDWDYLPDDDPTGGSWASTIKRNYHYNPLAYNPNKAYTPWVATTKNGTTAATTKANASYVAYTTATKASDRLKATYYDIKTSASGSTVKQCTSAYALCSGVPNPATGYKIVEVTIDAGDSSQLQNYVNWKTYYSTRRLMTLAAMSGVISDLSGVFMGVSPFNASASDYDWFSSNGRMFNLTVPAERDTLLAKLYTFNADGYTPTHRALSETGGQYANAALSLTTKNDDGTAKTGTGLVQYACQQNAALVVTDGYANRTVVPPPSYTQSKYRIGSDALPSRSLADLALAYFSINLRPDLPAGKSAGDNPNPHMLTYAMTLGIKGKVYGVTDAAANPTAVAWPSGSDLISSNTARGDENQIDDLYRATINGRGQMTTAGDVTSAVAALKAMIADILGKVSSGTKLAVSTQSVGNGDGKAYVATFSADGWYGDLYSAPIDKDTGNISDDAAIWHLKTTLDARTWTTRKIATYNGGTGVGFEYYAGDSRNTLESAAIANYLRGSRVGEGTTYRKRTSVLGDIVSAEPVLYKYSDGTRVIFQGANDGMLHAVDAANGDELWAYVPGQVLPKMKNLASLTYTHDYFVDGTPTISKVDSQIILVGNLRAGGKGVYALDVTSPTAADDSAVASKALWEFPKTSTATSTANGIGSAISSPRIARVGSATGDYRVLVASGYNNVDGNGHLFVLNVLTGAVEQDLVTPEASDMGNVTPYYEGTDSAPYVRFAYGADLQGRVWKFNLVTGDVTMLMQMKDASGNNQPITTNPRVMLRDGLIQLYVGTGRLLGETDKNSTRTQSFYMFYDRPAKITTNRAANMYHPTLAGSGTADRTITAPTVPFDTETFNGWYLDFPSGEQVSVNFSMDYGNPIVRTNNYSSSECESGSFEYVFNGKDGTQMPASFFMGGTGWGGRYLGSFMSSSPVVLMVSSGARLTAGTGSKAAGGDGLTPPPPDPKYQFKARSSASKRVSWTEVRR